MDILQSALDADDRSHLMVALPTGYGKTMPMLLLGHLLPAGRNHLELQKHRISFFLPGSITIVVTPTTTIWTAAGGGLSQTGHWCSVVWRGEVWYFTGLAWNMLSIRDNNSNLRYPLKSLMLSWRGGHSSLSAVSSSCKILMYVYCPFNPIGMQGFLCTGPGCNRIISACPSRPTPCCVHRRSTGHFPSSFKLASPHRSKIRCMAGRVSELGLVPAHENG